MLRTLLSGIAFVLALVLMLRFLANDITRQTVDYGPPPIISGELQDIKFEVHNEGTPSQSTKITSSTPIPNQEEYDALEEYWRKVLLSKKLRVGGGSYSQVSFPIDRLPENRRILKPSDGKTLDYQSGRINVKIDEDYNVLDVSFG